MATLGALLVLSIPILALVALAQLSERRRAHREREILQQIALTDALHERLGAVVAPVVHRRGRVWRVAVAVPFERPSVGATVLQTAHELFGGVRYEVVLSRQAPTVASPRTSRRAPLAQESLSWT
jgi:hypothetical protein